MELRTAFQPDETKELFAISRGRSDGPGKVIYHDLSQPLRPGENGLPEKIDIIIHTASVVDEASLNFMIIEKNLAFAYHVLEYARKANAKKIINLSSIAVYGNPTDERIFTESDLLRPHSTYGLSKHLAETMFNSRSEEGLEIINLRLGYVISQRLPSHSVIRKFAESLRTDSEITLMSPQASYINLIDIRDITRICEAFIYEQPAQELNCVTHMVSIEQIYYYLRELYPKSISNVKYENNLAKAIKARYSNERLHAFLPGDSFRDWKESLAWALN